MPFYVSPEQVMKDKADYARKGIARGRSVLVLAYADGILFVGENPSAALHKISEIYDRIAFAAVGKYNEFENLRVAGIRRADVSGFTYDRADVTGRSLANFYAQLLGEFFTSAPKPLEVELVVAEVGERRADDQMYRLTFDGSVGDEHGYVAMGGQSEPLAAYLQEHHHEDLPLAEALAIAVRALSVQGGDARQLGADQLEVAVLDRTRPRRKFKRLVGAPLTALLAQAMMAPAEPAEPGASPELPPAE